MEVISKSLKETEKIVKELLQEIQKLKENSRAALIFLKGDLGSGKTTLSQFLAKNLGIKEKVLSPTFVILKSYKLLEQKNFTKLIHIDAYRLKSGKELLDLGLKEILDNPKNLVIIEWPENISDISLKPTIAIQLTTVSENERKILIVPSFIKQSDENEDASKRGQGKL